MLLFCLALNLLALTLEKLFILLPLFKIRLFHLHPPSAGQFLYKSVLLDKAKVNFVALQNYLLP